MINNYLAAQIKEKFPFEPTEEQEISIKMLSQFIVSSGSRDVFVLRGYAGTGKTTLVGALVKALESVHVRSLLMAPTGRAAKVFSSYSGAPAYTIHKRIYRQKSILNSLVFTLSENLYKNTLFIVDEASMIADAGSSGFGSGRLLDDLIQFVYSGEGCHLLLLGDTAQLPPVGESESPALSSSRLASYGLQVVEAQLTQVMRQLQESGILFNATCLRQNIMEGASGKVPVIAFKGFSDIVQLPGNELMERLSGCYDSDGVEDTIVVCRSNKRTLIYNNGIRGRILYREEELNAGDYLMVVKNNYYWTSHLPPEERPAGETVDFIANGDVAVVRRVVRYHQLYGFRFARVELSFPDYNDLEMETLIVMDTLQSESPALTREESERLFQAVLADYADIRSKREQMKRLRENPYFNALQVKYAYAVTCHKAQGGQWKNVFVDQGYVPADSLSSDYYRWLYTAFTRASRNLYLVNWKNPE